MAEQQANVPYKKMVLYGQDVEIGYGTFKANPLDCPASVSVDRRTVAWVALNGKWGVVTNNVFHAYQGEQAKQMKHLEQALRESLTSSLQLKQRITDITR